MQTAELKNKKLVDANLDALEGADQMGNLIGQVGKSLTFCVWDLNDKSKLVLEDKTPVRHRLLLFCRSVLT